MAWLRRAISGALDATIRLAGRQRVVRAARFALNRARLDSPNSIESNGEALLQARVVTAAPGGTTIRVFDVGANEGQWSASMMQQAEAAGRASDLELHAFEPSTFTVDRLRAAMGDSLVSINQLALSDKIGAEELHVDGLGAGSNSLHSRTSAPGTTEIVNLSTIDAYCADHSINSINLVKIDTEGHDMSVIEGARKLLAARAVGIVQFEYNHRWISARRYLRDAFDLFQPLGYTLGKLTPTGVEVYPGGWDWELESFVEGNYIAFLPEIAQALPRLPWWKQQ
jgi:FkbM family methyltransferase